MLKSNISHGIFFFQVSKFIFIGASVYAEGTGDLAKLPRAVAYAGVRSFGQHVLVHVFPYANTLLDVFRPSMACLVFYYHLCHIHIRVSRISHRFFLVFA